MTSSPDDAIATELLLGQRGSVVGPAGNPIPVSSPQALVQKPHHHMYLGPLEVQVQAGSKSGFLPDHFGLCVGPGD